MEVNFHIKLLLKKIYFQQIIKTFISQKFSIQNYVIFKNPFL